MTDRELLYLAAKAAGYVLTWDGDNPPYPRAKVDSRNLPWNPLTDDGDALRLAVKLRMCVDSVLGGDVVQFFVKGNADDTGIRCEDIDITNDDRYAATRRAIVRAAAAIARSLNGSPGSESTRPDQPKLPESGGIGVSSIGLGAEGEQ